MVESQIYVVVTLSDASAVTAIAPVAPFVDECVVTNAWF
jgi:hypothetical protein